MKTIAVITIAMLALTSVACKKSVKGESRSWTVNRDKVTRLSQAYPAYAQFLDVHLKEAEKKWNEAEKIGDEEQKAKKMDEANTVLETGLVGDLGSAEHRMASIRTKQEKIAHMRFPGPVIGQVNRTMSGTVDMVTQARTILMAGGATPELALDAVRQANSKLIMAEGNLDRTLRLATR